MTPPQNYLQNIAGPAGPGDPSGYRFAWLLSTVLVVVLAVRVDPLTENHPAYAGGDHLAYIGMAEDPGVLRDPPFCYRVLVPTLARFLPFGLTANFYLLMAGFLLLCGVLMYSLLRRMGEDVFFALMGVVFFYSLNWGPKFLLHGFWMVDGALFFFVLLALYLLSRNLDAGVTLALSLGVLAKEPALFVLPLLYTFRARRLIDGDAARRSLLTAAPPIVIFALLRLLIPKIRPYDPWSLFLQNGIPRLTEGLYSFVRGGTVGTWGVLLLVLIFFSGREYRGFALRGAAFLFLVYLQPLFASNVDRLLVLAFPIVIPPAVAGLRRLSVTFSLSRWMTAGYAAVPFIVVLMKPGWQSPSPEKRALYLAVWTIVVVAARRFAGRR